jgi:hypothetical protein
MITQYIHDTTVQQGWDITVPAIRQHHTRIVTEWVSLSTQLREAIHRADLPAAVQGQRQLNRWIWTNVELLQHADGLYTGHSDWHADLIMDAYLEWGVRLLPFSDEVTRHVTAALARFYEGDPDDMLWEYLLDQVWSIVEYQLGRNTKPITTQTREELLRTVSQMDTDSLRRLLQ